MLARLYFALPSLLTLACSSTEASAPPENSGTGTSGVPNTGGTSNSGGTAATEGTPGMGGSVAGSNGAPADGGATGTPGGGAGGNPAGASGMGSPPTGGNAGDGASGGAGAPPVGANPKCSGDELLCEDFEAVAEGAVPGGAWEPLDDSCQFQAAQFTMGVSSEQVNPASGSTKALKITNKHFPQCRLSGAFQPVDDFWVRAFMYWGPELDLSNRETLAIDLTPGFRTADDPALRFGSRSKSPCEMFAGPQITIIGIGGGEVTGCGSRVMPQGEWFCFEAHITQNDVIDVSTFLDGEALSYQSSGKPETSSIASSGPAAEKLDHIRLGIFSTGEAQGNIFIDDVAVATSRLGCGM